MNKRHLLFITLFFHFALPSATALSKQIVIDSEAQFEYARQTIEKGDYQRAVVELERFVYFFPGDENVPKAHTLIGLCYIEVKDYERARKILMSFLRDDPQSPQAGEALFLIGDSYFRQGVEKEAEYYFKRVLKENPDPSLKNRTLYRLGWNRLQADKWQEASEAFEHVERSSPLYIQSRDLAEQSLLGEELPLKNPVTSGVMAAVLPGLGHAYCNRYKDGLVSFLLNGLFIWATLESFNRDHEVLGGMLGFLELGWYSGNIYSAVNCTHKYNRKVKEDFRRNLSGRLRLQPFSSKEGHMGLAVKFNF
jgi:TolA-binding protein